MRDTNFDRHFDLDRMLWENAKWLFNQRKLEIREFSEIASQLELRQQDWNYFWKLMRNEI